MSDSIHFGYRVYTLAVGRRNRWRKAESLSDLGAAFNTRVYGLLKDVKGEILKYSPDLVVADGSVRVPESDAGQPVMVISEVGLEGAILQVEVIAGTFGDHDELVGEDIVKISDRAAGRRYRLDIVFPAAGTNGMLVAETRRRYTPVEPFLRWLAWLDLRATLTAEEEIEAQVKEKTLDEAQAEALLKNTVWRKFRVSQVADRNYLRKLISQAKKVNVDLVQAGGLTKRGRFREVEKRLSVLDVDEGIQAKLADEILSWLDSDGSTGAMKRVMKTLGLSPKKLAQDGLEFTNTAVHMRASQTVSVSPGNVRDLFTYPLAATVRPDAIGWSQATRAKLVELAALEQVELDL